MQRLESPLRVLIAGGGISGITLAALLERQGHSIDLIERGETWNSGGGGITLTLNGMKLLNEIGIGHSIESVGNPINKIKITDSNDKLLSVFDLSNYSADYAKTVTIQRKELHKLLAGMLQQTNVLFGKTCNTIHRSDTDMHVHFNDGSYADYDLIAGCDGMYSAVRNSYFKEQNIDYAGYVCWRFVVNTSEELQHIDSLKEMWGRGRRFGIVPLNKNQFHCFASLSTDRPEQYKNTGNAELRNLFSVFKGVVPELLSCLTDETVVYFNRLENLQTGSWVKDNVVLIGDAAHGMTPNLTQGASMAIEDAVCLSNLLNSGNDVKSCLNSFYSERKQRTLSIQRKSDWLGKIGQISSPLLSSIRNICWQQLPDRWIQNDFEKLLIRNIISYMP